MAQFNVLCDIVKKDWAKNQVWEELYRKMKCGEAYGEDGITSSDNSDIQQVMQVYDDLDEECLVVSLQVLKISSK